jgi:hypothetical protein
MFRSPVEVAGEVAGNCADAAAQRCPATAWEKWCIAASTNRCASGTRWRWKAVSDAERSVSVCTPVKPST